MPLDLETATRLVDSVPTWYHSVPLMPGLVTPGRTASEPVWERLGLPDDLSGLRVLDIGTAEGYFAFRAERAGADVVAIDSVRRPGFEVCQRILDSRVDYRICTIWDLDAAMGTFDVVLFLGVLYHLRDPMAALHLLHTLCRGELFVESFVADELLAQELSASPGGGGAVADLPVMRFFKGATLSGDPSNFWGPNHACLVQMLEESGFEVAGTSRSGDRAYARCRPLAGTWQDPVQIAASAWRSAPRRRD